MAEIAIDKVNALKTADLHDLCDAADDAIRAGGGFGWVEPPPRDVMERFWKGVLVVPERVLFVARLDGVVAGSAQLVKPPRNNEAQAHAAQLTTSRDMADYFEAVARALPEGQAKQAANWIMGELAAALNRSEIEVAASPVAAPALAALIARILDGTISNKIARDVFAGMWAGEQGGQPDAIIEARGLKQISDTGAIGAMIDEVLAANPAVVEEYRAGKQKAFNSLVGQIMKAARGKANPQQVNELLKQKLDA